MLSISKVHLKAAIVPFLVVIGSVANNADMADQSAYYVLIPMAAIMLFSAVITGAVVWKDSGTRAKIAIGLSITVCVLQLPDLIGRRLPYLLGH